ncbi:MAG: PEGA domain-containing protein [Planctomycetota bacterium]|jgi:hypothetical protein
MQKRILELGALALLFVALQGCVTRELVITSEPSGAKVRINDTYEGTTPMRHRFTHYQVFGIRLEVEGYRPLYAEEHVVPPGYERPGVDFFAEVGPWHLHDRREFHYRLEKVVKPDNVDTVLQHAEAARERVQRTAREQAAKDQERRERLEGTHRAVPLPLKKRVREAEEKEALEKQGEVPAPDSATPDTPKQPEPVAPIKEAPAKKAIMPEDVSNK